MLSFILAELIAAANPLPAAMLQAQANVPTEAPKARKMCRDVQVPHTRTLRRVCTTVEVERRAPTAGQAAASPPPVATTLGVGMLVVDTQGGAVGTITAVAADTVTVKTARHQAELPKTSLTISQGKALFGLTQAALDASVERALAAVPRAELKVGTPVKGTDGVSVGTIDAIEPADVTIRLSGGQRISIPRTSIAVDAGGGGVIGLTAAELEARVKAAQPSP